MHYLLECTEFNGEYEYPFRILVETNLAPDEESSNDIRYYAGI